jgi:hypothetical protein
VVADKNPTHANNESLTSACPVTDISMRRPKQSKLTRLNYDIIKFMLQLFILR